MAQQDGVRQAGQHTALKEIQRRSVEIVEYYVHNDRAGMQTDLRTQLGDDVADQIESLAKGAFSDGYLGGYADALEDVQFELDRQHDDVDLTQLETTKAVRALITLAECFPEVWDMVKHAKPEAIEQIRKKLED